MRPHFKHEDAIGAPVCGIDEVGRGPLAGPVVAAAVMIHRDRAPQDVLDLINDSKQVKPETRAKLFALIPTFAEVEIATCCNNEIDKINIYHASHLAMRKAYDALCARLGSPIAALIDGNRGPKLAGPHKTIVKGDTISLSIAAASIMAKHHRDILMQQYAEEFPVYGWTTNAGYGTPEHLQAIAVHGITRLHRLSFAPVKKYA